VEAGVGTAAIGTVIGVGAVSGAVAVVDGAGAACLVFALATAGAGFGS